MKRVFLDANVILDVLLERKDFVDDAVSVFSMLQESGFRGYTSATLITTICYLLKRVYPKEKTYALVQNLLSIVEVVPVHKSTITSALSAGWGDFEDAVQYTCAEESEMDFFITRNIKDFQKGMVQILTPKAFLDIMRR